MYSLKKCDDTIITGNKQIYLYNIELNKLLIQKISFLMFIKEDNWV